MEVQMKKIRFPAQWSILTCLFQFDPGIRSQQEAI